MKITNPILRGFNPDPSIVRVGSDYYIATSTFEWFPGVQVHHSRDLKNWKLITRPLKRKSQLDLPGVPDSCGVWAPCLSYDNGIFYLVFSNVHSFDGVWKDTPNYLVTTRDIAGDWSDPVKLAATGFDASLFHDDDGRKWYVTMLVDHRKGRFFGGIELQEYSVKEKTLVGPVHYIFEGTEIGLTEGPHLYKLNGYYYLLTAEGGTGYAHSVTLARSRNITGPYEVHPANPVCTAEKNPDLPLQKTGHADLVESQNGNWYMVHLAARPLSKRGRCILGRETAIQQVEWRDDGWLYLKEGGNEPCDSFETDEFEELPFEQEAARDDFDAPELGVNFQTLRVPADKSWLTLEERKSFLRLYGRESLNSFHYQSLVARRLQNFNAEVSTCLEFQPVTFQQMAGLVMYYNTSHYYYLYLSTNDCGKTKCLTIISCDKFKTTEPLDVPLELGTPERVNLKAVVHTADLQFYFSLDNEKTWEKIGPVLDASILSDDYVSFDHGRYRPGFTGAFAGICCQDLSGQQAYADFDWFYYKAL